jgi:8-oxo-dGTP pyrophosphatase MutT (NUDIX family)
MSTPTSPVERKQDAPHHPLRDTLQNNLRTLAALPAAPFPAHALEKPLRPAAVVLIVGTGSVEGTQGDTSNEPWLMITLRAARLNTHAGQFAFPGGRVDAGETPLQAALRETREEVGLVLEDAHLVGCLDDYPTRSGFRITPFVAWMPAGGVVTPNPSEVARVFRIPLRELQGEGMPEFSSGADSAEPILRYPLLGTRIHAPSAALMYQLVEVGLHGRMTRVAHMEAPVWAWK